MFSLIKAPYFYWDDEWMIVTNPYLTKFDLDSMSEMLFSSFKSQYSPVNSLLYAGIISVFDFNSLVFHVVCLALHIINTLLVFRFINLLIRLKYGTLYTQRELFFVSAAVSLLFGISPLQIESVAWISASKILLFSFFVLLSCNHFFKYLERRKKIDYFLSGFYFLLALGSKEQAVVLPVILLLILLFFNRGKKDLILLIPFFIVSVFSGVLSLAVQDDGFSKTLTNDYYPLHQRIVLSCYTVTQYLVKILLPFRQWVFYKFPMEPGEPLPILYYLYPMVDLVLAYLAYLLFRSKKYDYVSFGLCFFLINIFLTLHIIPLGRQSLMADRYVYLPLIGVFFPISMYLLDVYKNLKTENNRYRFIGWFLLYILLVYSKSIYYIIEWSDHWLSTITT
jgi:hypothetical protein